MPLLVHHLRLRAMALQVQGAATLRPGQMIPAALVAPAVPDPAGRADPVVLDLAVRVAQADPVVLDLAVRVVRASMAQAVRAALTVPAGPAARADPDTRVVPASTVLVAPADLVVPAARVDRADRADPVVLGTGTIIGATSTTHRGATDPALGATASRPGRRGIDRSRRPADGGTVARSTIGATRKPRCGIPVSTSGALTSSESGFRCK
jgi:hypothetical protein